MNTLGFIGSLSVTQVTLLIILYFSFVGYMVYLAFKIEVGFRSWLWAIAIIFIPIFGAIAYFFKHYVVTKLSAK